MAQVTVNPINTVQKENDKMIALNWRGTLLHLSPSDYREFLETRDEWDN